MVFSYLEHIKRHILCGTVWKHTKIISRQILWCSYSNKTTWKNSTVRWLKKQDAIRMPLECEQAKRLSLLLTILHWPFIMIKVILKPWRRLPYFQRLFCEKNKTKLFCRFAGFVGIMCCCCFVFFKFHQVPGAIIFWRHAICSSADAWILLVRKATVC